MCYNLVEIIYMGFENFGFRPEQSIEQDLFAATERLADSLRELSPEDRGIFNALNDASNSYFESGR